jgi:hypothetical protein
MIINNINRGQNQGFSDTGFGLGLGGGGVAFSLVVKLAMLLFASLPAGSAE